MASEPVPEGAGHRGTTDRASYLIDRFRVNYEFGGGWTCGCREFASQDSCKHTREVAGRRVAQREIVHYLHQGRSVLVPMRANAVKIETWEGEEGATGRISPDVVRILIVDNDMRCADSLERMLNAAGYAETRVACSAHAALVLAVEFPPDIAILEMNLPDMDANDLAQRLRESARIHVLRLIAMTSSRQHDSRDLARNAGFERYLLKPIAAADLSTLLDVQPRHGAISQG